MRKSERVVQRVAEAMHSLEGDVVVVAQGDEPLLMPADLSLVAAPFQKMEGLESVSLLSPLEDAADFTNSAFLVAIIVSCSVSKIPVAW